MPITAYSKTFKSELSVEQFKDRYEELIDKPNIHEFVKTDIECSCCGSTGAKIISEGISSKTKQKVKQTHFAFRDENGGDSHKVFCDHYSGEDKQSTATNEVLIDLLKKSQSEVTLLIGKFVSTAIQNNIFSQEDIRNMRQWFFNMRSRQDFVVKNSTHHLNIIKKTIFYINKDSSKEYVIDKNILNEDNFDLDQEVYKSLATKFPFPQKAKEINGLTSYFHRKEVIKKAISISKKGHGLYEFDREILQEKYNLATKLSLSIVKSNSLLSRKISYSHTAVRSKNPLMAYAATLLFVNNWNIEKATEMHNLIENLPNTDNSLGNVIGLNPFINYEAWITLKFSLIWKNDFTEYNFDEEFNKEKNRLEEIYGL